MAYLARTTRRSCSSYIPLLSPFQPSSPRRWRRSTPRQPHPPRHTRLQQIPHRLGRLERRLGLGDVVLNNGDSVVEGFLGEGGLEVAHADEVEVEDRGEEGVLEEDSAEDDTGDDRNFGVGDQAHGGVVVRCCSFGS